MIKVARLLTLLILIVFTQKSIASNVEKSGDILQILIPALGYGTSLYLEDKEGQMEFYKSFGTSLAITYTLKYSINRQRPNGADYSFPSGHTTSAFQGASFIHQRYGIKYAIPAYLGAIFVGYSRVDAKAHYTSDVIAGALIGTLSSWYFTTEYKGYDINPQIMGSGVGVEVKRHF